MTRKSVVFLIGEKDDNHSDACWELNLEHGIMVKKKDMKNKRFNFGGAVI